ncbi:MAG: aminotransferase class I/II-fold pyridoxal phosphate-dependent enzyme [Candidatus Krumholzibacteriota bacterium]|nr:aminotransferase class I/II-fold pyridoxal phosphate-dependent enzyme [Candidatus Krumholzibacteriota bacterium]
MRPLRKQADKPHPSEKKEDAAQEDPPSPAPEAVEDHTLDYDYSNFFWGTGTDAFGVLEHFDAWFTEAKPAGYYLFGMPMETAPTTRVDVIEQKGFEELKGLINFASYNYLGLSGHPEVIEAAVEATRKYGTGASGSPILSGQMDLHEEFARRIAKFKGTEEALLFPSGYSGNLGIIAGVMRAGDLVVTDQYAHASIVDGIILSKAKVRYFRHNSAADLERKLRDFDGRKLVVVEGVYSMDGDLARLPEIVEVCKRNGARIMIDEAHSAFLFGKTGKGVVEHFGLNDEIDIHFGTFSKTLGGQGGYVAGPKILAHACSRVRWRQVL